MTLLHAALISLAQLLLCGLCGLGLATLLPQSLRAQQLTLAPAIGLACLAIVGFYGTVAGLTLRQLLPLVLVVALIGLALAVRARGRRRLARFQTGSLASAAASSGSQHQLPSASSALPADDTAPGPRWREGLGLAAVALVTWLLAMAPALANGRLMPVGYGMDVEFYMGLAAYLKDWSYVSLPQAPANPIRELIGNDYIGIIAFGGAYAQGMADLLGGWEAWRSWMPFQATLRVIAALALFALLRATLEVPAPGALVGTLLAGLSGLLLWLTYNNFSASLAGLPALIAALAVTPAALERNGRGALLLGALLIGGLACLYWPMLTAFGALGLGLGVAALWASERRGPVVLRGAALLAAGALVGLLPNLRAPRAFPGLFEASNPYMGIDFFVPPQVIAGTLRFTHPEPLTPALPEQALGLAGLIALMLLLGLGLWRGGERRLRVAALGACALLYLLGLRFAVGYPYGFFRGASYVAPVLLGIAGAGIHALGSLPIPRTPARAPRPVLLVLALIAMAASGTAALTTARSYATIGGYPPAADDIGPLAHSLDRPGPVLFSSAAATALCGNRQSAWAYWLRDRPLLGQVRSVFAASDNPRGAAVPAYGVLLAGEDPAAHGLAPGPLWQDDLVQIYAAPPASLSWLSGLDRYSLPPRCADGASNSFRAAFGLGQHAAALPDRPLTIYANADAVSLAPLSGGGGGAAARSLRLTMVSFVTQTVEVDVGGATRPIELPSGVSSYVAPLPDVPTALQLRPSDDALLLRSAELLDGAAAPAIEPTAALLLGSTVAADGATLDVELRVRNQSGQAVRLALELYQEVYGYAAAPARYAGGAIALPGDGDYRLSLDLQAPAATLDGAQFPLEAGAIADGRYYAALWVYQGEQLRQQIPLATFERQGGTIGDVRPQSADAVIVPLGPPDRPLDVQAGEAIRLAGYELSAQAVLAGEPLRVSLLWEGLAPIPTAYQVFVQLLDADDGKAAQWDGAAGGDWLPTPAWRPGQQIWQDVPLTVATDAAPGRYRVAVGLYDPATGARLPLSSGGDMLTLAEIEVGE